MKNLTCGVFGLVSLVFLGCASTPKPHLILDLKPTVLLVSLDGFRPDYLNSEMTPFLLSLGAQGVRAEKMLPVFPSLTFPNHYSIITGLYPENHGIVANSMRDPKIKETFAISQAAIVDDPRWWGGEPLWVTARKQGQLSASMFWVGSSVGSEMARPNDWLPYDKSLPRENRVKQILAWLDRPVDQRPTFLTLYFEDVDSAGHEFGPGSAQVRAATQNVDSALALLNQGLRDRGIEDKLNLIVVSDHGMAEVPSDHYLFLEDSIDLNSVEVIGGGSMIGIHPKPGQEKSMIRKLKKANPHLTIYSKNEIPARYHYRNSPRIPPYIGLADLGWYIGPSRGALKKKALGMHGYDPSLKEMAALFVARGPAFKSGYVSKPFSNLTIYPLVTHLLGLTPAPHDGNFSEGVDLLKSK